MKPDAFCLKWGLKITSYEYHTMAATGIWGRSDGSPLVGSRGEAPVGDLRAETVCRYCLQNLTEETIKIWKCCTLHLLILDQYIGYVSRWGAKRHLGGDTPKSLFCVLLPTDTRHVLKFRKDLFRCTDGFGSKKSYICKTDAVAIGLRRRPTMLI